MKDFPGVLEKKTMYLTNAHILWLGFIHNSTHQNKFRLLKILPDSPPCGLCVLTNKNIVPFSVQVETGQLSWKWCRTLKSIDLIELIVFFNLYVKRKIL